jgi:predicted nucleotidyltransferase
MRRFKTLGLAADNVSLLQKLVAAGIRFLLVGGAAVRVYAGASRRPKDLDVLLDPEIGNAERLYRLLQECGITTNFEVEELTRPKKQIALKSWYPYNADLITPSADFDFPAAYERSEVVTIAGQRLSVISMPDLMAIKSNTGRERDRQDLKLLLGQPQTGLTAFSRRRKGRAAVDAERWARQRRTLRWPSVS